MKYFRDIPRESTVTPAEATYLYYFNKRLNGMEGKQSKIVAATILNLALKEYIKLRVKENNIYVKIIKEPEGLKKDELAVYKILKRTGKNSEFKINEIN